MLLLVWFGCLGLFCLFEGSVVRFATTNDLGIREKKKAY